MQRLSSLSVLQEVFKQNPQIIQDAWDALLLNINDAWGYEIFLKPQITIPEDPQT